MNIFVILIAIIFLVAIIMGIQYLLYLDTDQKNPWQQLAASNNLDFVSGTFFNPRAFIFGDYRQHHLVLDTFQQNRGRGGAIYTRLTLFANLATDGDSKQPPLNIQNALAQLNAIHLNYPLKGWVQATTLGQTVGYEQQGVEEDPEYLQSLFDLLSDVADTYPAITTLGGEAVSTLHTISTKLTTWAKRNTV